MVPRRARLAMYGKPSDLPALDWSWVDAQLAEAGTYWVVAGGDRPHPRPVWGVWRDHRLYLSVGSPTLAREMVEGARVAVHLDSGVDVVVVEGVVGRRTGAAEILRDYDGKYGWRYAVEAYGPLTCVEAIDVISWRSGGWAGRDGFQAAGRWRFDQRSGEPSRGPRSSSAMRDTAVRSRLTVAVAQPACVPGDLAANAASHRRTVLDVDADVVVFPELSLPGYDLAHAPIEPDHPALAPIVEACARQGTTAFVGAAVRAPGGVFIATLAVTGDGVGVGYRKMYPGEDERDVFDAGVEPGVVEVAGWRLGLGICKDTRMPGHLEATLAEGIDLYVAGLVHHPDELADQDARAASIVRRGGVPVAFASAAGDVGAPYPSTAGHSCIWSGGGRVLARCGGTPNEAAVAHLAP